MALAHREGKDAASYAGSTLFERRRAVMLEYVFLNEAGRS
jgi:hypothetical protein